MGFEQGLSGLNTSSQNLNVIGNNIANASTVGFKSSTTQFADVYASSLFGATSQTAGIGTQISDIAQNFNQGNITVTNNPLDIAINGAGFFILSDQGATTYSRNGQFHLDSNGNLVNSTGQNVMGYSSLIQNTSGGAVTGLGTPSAININVSNLTPNATSGSDGVAMSINLDANAAILSGSTFNASDPTSYNYSTPITVYDSLGRSHALSLYFTRETNNAAGSTWQVNATIDGSASGVTLNNSTLTFDTSGNLVSPTTGSPLSFSTTSLAATGAMDFTNVGIQLTGSTQVAGTSGLNSISQNGNSGGSLAGLTVDSAGVIYGQYSNGQSKALRQIALANFTNPNGLVPMGDNQWNASLAAGQPTVGAPGTGLAGTLQSGATEDSNVDLTNSLVDLIVAQREYQANAQTIKAEDTILQTLVNLG